MAPHAHAQPRLVVVLDGTFEERYADGTRYCAGASAIYRPKHEIHSEHFTAPGGAYVSISLSDEWLDRNIPADYDLKRGRSVRSERIATLGRAFTREIMLDDAWSRLSFEGLALEVLAEVARANQAAINQRPRWFAAVCERIKMEPSQSITLAGLAALARVRPAQISRAFRRYLGTTMGEYIRLQRVESARILMDEGELALAQIAAATGFCDQGHMSRCFKRLYGITPSAYRSRYKGAFHPNSFTTS